MTLALYLRELRELQERRAAEAHQPEPQPPFRLTDEQARAIDDTAGIERRPS
jgi:hypothetical protein